METTIDILLQEKPLSVDACLEKVTHPGAGGLCVFVGNVRDSTKGKQVLHLEFEAYAPMAKTEMEKIALKMQEQWPCLGIAIHHRLGHLNIKETAVIIAVSCPHRAAAFAACQFAIDTLRETVPIWKKEIFEDGEVWVAAHP